VRDNVIEGLLWLVLVAFLLVGNEHCDDEKRDECRALGGEIAPDPRGWTCDLSNAPPEREQ
jgi:hypothetical protein